MPETVKLNRTAVLLPAGVDVEVGSEWVILNDDGRTLTAALAADHDARLVDAPPVIQALAAGLEEGDR